MADVLTVHEPLLVNTLAYSTGAIIFGIFLYLLLRDRAGARLRGSRLTLFATTLALLWNLCSLLVTGWSGRQTLLAAVLLAVSFTGLSLLPGVLFHLSLGGNLRPLRIAGYMLSAVTVAIHSAELFADASRLHRLALQVTSFGFALLTLAGATAMLRARRSRRSLTSRLVATMSLFLFSVSFVHFGASEAHSWPAELLAHHAGIPLALLVLLQDYRFLLLDAFARFLANILLAAVFVFAAFRIIDPRSLFAWAGGQPFREGLLMVGACLALPLFAFLRNRLDALLTRLVFPRRNLGQLGTELAAHASSARDESEFLEMAAERIAASLDAQLVRHNGLLYKPSSPCLQLPSPVTDLPLHERAGLLAAGVEAVLPLRFPADTRYFLLGRRRGGRRYLSEDYAVLARVQAEVVEQLERFREREMRTLVTQAELRALQAQIHPHFLFNALNTIYGIIPRTAEGARRTLLNLADILRYFLRSDRALIPLEEEISIVRAYLEIEALRLGDKLTAEVEIEPRALRIPIPILTIEPLVENAVKHGVSQLPGGGKVRVEVKTAGASLLVRVFDSGPGFRQPNGPAAGAGVGLDNVNRRLRLCYGPNAGIEVDSTAEGAVVGFAIPVKQSGTVAG